ncbi:hypothetical protein B5M50_04585 [candidate division KSB1 bacterium 4484_219]|nr:MAG: hypothetical protein B5M50_04585 [candidate division KSB1 bacterium 4484_219]RKY88520.1 MAG: hypothetical protein DRQ11_03470 [candidate division KSB1 bacterium]
MTKVINMRNSIGRLVDTLNSYHRDLNILLNISNEQNLLLQQKTIDRLYKSKLEKEKMLHKLQHESQKIQKFYQTWIEIDSKISPEQRLQIWRLLDSILQLTHSVLTIEQENQRLIESTKDELLSQIQQFYFAKN